MNNAISKYFESPEDKEPTFIRLVRNILIFTVIATILSAVALTTEPDQTGVAITIYVLVVSVILEVIALVFTFRGNLIFAKVVVPIMLIITITISEVPALRREIRAAAPGRLR